MAPNADSIVVAINALVTGFLISISALLVHVPNAIEILVGIIEQLQKMLLTEESSDLYYKGEISDRLNALYKKIKRGNDELCKNQLANNFSDELQDIVNSLQTIIFSIVPFDARNNSQLKLDPNPFTALTQTFTAINLDSYTELQKIEKKMNDLLCRINTEKDFWIRMKKEMDDMLLIGFIMAHSRDPHVPNISIIYDKNYLGANEFVNAIDLKG